MGGFVRVVLPAALVIGASLAQGRVAAAADASVTPTSASPGQQVTVQGFCLTPVEPGDGVDVLFRQGTAGQVVASGDLDDSNGTFSLPVTIPHMLGGQVIEPGPATLEVICVTPLVDPPVLLPFTVLADLGAQPPAPATDPPVPATPADPAADPAAAVLTAPRFTG